MTAPGIATLVNLAQAFDMSVMDILKDVDLSEYERRAK